MGYIGLVSRNDDAWVEARLVELDEVREIAAARTELRSAGEGEPFEAVPAPDGKEVRECIRLSAELRGLLGAAAKRATALDPGKGDELPDDPAELIKLHEEKIAQLRAMLPAAAKETGGKDARH